MATAMESKSQRTMTEESYLWESKARGSAWQPNATLPVGREHLHDNAILAVEVQGAGPGAATKHGPTYLKRRPENVNSTTLFVGIESKGVDH